MQGRGLGKAALDLGRDDAGPLRARSGRPEHPGAEHAQPAVLRVVWFPARSARTTIEFTRAGSRRRGDQTIHARGRGRAWASTLRRAFRITTWGESHGPALGVVIEGCPAGLPLDDALIQHDLDRRRVGQSKVTSPRNERDRVQILSGVFEGQTTGAPISLITYNADADSSKYDIIRDMYRPGHADYTYTTKYGIRDHRGGGRSSARETWGRVAAGAIARDIAQDSWD